MTHESHFNGDTLTLTSPHGSIVLSQGQCASIVIMAEKHNAADKPAPSLAAWASGHCPTCHQHKDVMGMPCNDPWHVEQVCAIGRADQPAADKPAPVMTAVLLSQAEIDALGTYDHSLPTGTRIGKRWKKSDGKGGWKMGEYVEDADPKMVGIRWTTIHVKGQTADQPAGDDAAVEDGSHNDIGFLRRSLADMHAHADALKSGWDACDEQRKEAMASLERALAEVADLRAKLAEAEKEIAETRTALGDTLGKDYLHAASAVAALATERDRLAARVAELERDADPPVCRLQLPDGRVPVNARAAAEAWHAVADKALADLAAEQTAHVNTGARCAALGHTLDAMTERAEKAEHKPTYREFERLTADAARWKDKALAAIHYATEIADHAEACGIVRSPAYDLAVQRVRAVRECDTPIPGLIRECYAARAEAAQWKSSSDAWETKWNDVTERAEAELKHANEWARKAHEARAEADALRTDRDLCKQDAENMAANAHRAEAERDALKARKVTLPRFLHPLENYTPNEVWKSWKAAVLAAGVEVEQ